MRHTPMILACMALLTAGRFAVAQQAVHVKPELVVAAESVKPGETVDLAVRFSIEPEWHMYWLNPGDSGLPPTVEWTLPSGVTVEPVRFPVPKAIDTGNDMTSFGYEDELVLLTRLKVPADFTGGTLPITARLDWLVCREKCVMEAASVSATLAVGPARPAHAEQFAQWKARLPEPAENVQAKVTRDGTSNGTLTLTLPDHAVLQEFFAPPNDDVVFAPLQIPSDAAGMPVRISFRVLNSAIKRQTSEAIIVYTDPAGKRHAVAVPVTIE